MAVDLMPGYSLTCKMEEDAAKEAVEAGYQSVDKLIRLLSKSNNFQADGVVDCRAVADVAVDKFRKFISVLDGSRTGHARYRRGPILKVWSKPEPVWVASQISKEVESVSGSKIYSSPAAQRLPPLPLHHHQQSGRKESTTTINFASPSSSFITSLTEETNTLQTPISSGFQITNLSQISSTGRPPISTSSFKRKCSSMDDSNAKCDGGGSTASRCHCPKKRKSRTKRVVRIPAISMKMADIPPDDYSWRKYGQKPIKGSPHPRGYYKCSSVRGCPARKHVERAIDEPTMLIVTYEGEHNHSLSTTKSTALVLNSS